MLNAKQSKFASEYAIDFNATQAAIRAGYSGKTAYSQGQRLLKKAEVAAAIELKQQALAVRNEITRDEVVGYLREAIEIARRIEAPNALAQAAYKLAVVCGLDAPQRQEITQTQAPPPLPAVEELLAGYWRRPSFR